MRFPKKFYHDDALSTEAYQVPMSHQPAWEQFFIGDPKVWVCPEPPVEEKKKTIVIGPELGIPEGDFEAVDARFQALQTTVARLLDEKFEVLLWQGDKPLQKMSEENLRLIGTYIGNLCQLPSNFQEVAQKASGDPLHLSADQYVLVDLDEMASVFEGKDYLPQSLALHQLTHTRQRELSNSIRYLKQKAAFTRTPIETIVLDEYSTEAFNVFKVLDKAFPGATLLTQYRRVDLKRTEECPAKLDVDTLREVEALEIDEAYREEAILDLLRVMSNSLQKVGYEGSLKFRDFPESFPKLRTLNLFKPEGSTVQAWLERSSVLEKLTLFFFTQHLNLRGLRLTHLQTIHLCFGAITAGDFNILLSSAEGLQELKLENIRANEGWELPKRLLLKDISINRSKIDTQSLFYLLQSSPNLKHLFLGGCYFDNNHASCEGLSLNELETLDLSESDVNCDMLSVLLKATPNLKKLILNKCLHIHSPPALIGIHLEKLEELLLDGSSINATLWESLLHAAPNLQKLNCVSCQNLKGELNLGRGSLSKLQSIKCRGDISSQQIQSLFEAVSVVRTLELLIDLSEGGFDIKGEWSKLENLSVFRWPKEKLRDLLSQTQRLKKIEIIHSDLTHVFDDLPPRCLAELQSFYSDKSISLTDLYHVLSHAPQLQKIVDCKVLDEDTPETTLLDIQSLNLTHLTLSKSVFSQARFYELLCALPRIEKLKINRLKINESVPKTSLSFPKHGFSNLKELTLTDINLDASSLSSICLAAPGMETLVLSKLKLQKEPLNLPAGSLASLKILRIETDLSDSTMDQIISLWQSSTQLTEVSIHFVGNAANVLETLEIMPSSLPGVKNLELKSSHPLKPMVLTHFIRAAAQIETLDISSQDITGLDLKPNTLPHLIKIKIQYCSDAEKLKFFYYMMLDAAPKLRREDIVVIGAPYSYSQQIASDGLPTLGGGSTSRSSVEGGSGGGGGEIGGGGGEIGGGGGEIGSGAGGIGSGAGGGGGGVVGIGSGGGAGGTAESGAGGSKPEALDSKPETPLYPSPAHPEPVHDVQKRKDFKPHDSSTPVPYEGINKNHDQKMIIEKLSRYYSLPPGHHMAWIHKIQDGICRPLSHYFVEHQGDWDAFMTLLHEWEGDLPIDSRLEVHFRDLTTVIQREQVEKWSYVGASFEAVLRSSTKPLFVGNPWHQVVVMNHGDHHVFYDPNALKGPRRVETSELSSTLLRAMGPCLSITPLEHPLKLTPFAAGPFLKEGGLLALCQCENKQAIFSALTNVKDLKPEELEGLFLRNMHGVPAWVLGLNGVETEKLTQQWLAQWKKLHPADHQELMKKSTEAMQHRSFVPIAYPTELPSEPKPISYDSLFQTWDNKERSILSPQTYFINCTHGLFKKRCVTCDGEQDLDGLYYGLARHCLTTHKPMFYVDSPSQLHCIAPCIKPREDGKTGTLMRGPSGLLYDFLTNPRNTEGVLIVNFSHFKSSDLVAFNSMLDGERKIQGVPIPEGVVIIGMLDSQKELPGNDFYSRFQRSETCPLSSDHLSAFIPEPLPMSEGKAHAMPLFEARDWKERLMGRWLPGASGWHLEEGLLKESMDKATPKQPFQIEIQHGPWRDKEFVRFWREATLDERFKHLNLHITRSSTDEHWTFAHHCFQHDEDAGVKRVVLSPFTINTFFRKYKVNEKKEMVANPGEIASTGAPYLLHVYLTHSISEKQWAELLYTCDHQTPKVTLCVKVAPGASLPESFEPSRDRIPLKNPSLSLIQSTDPDSTISMLKERYPDALILDITECHVSDLIEKLSYERIDSADGEVHYLFSTTPCALKEALSRKQPVILKGQHLEKLSQELAEALLSNQEAPLMIVSEDLSAFDYLPFESHEVTPEEKCGVLQRHFSEDVFEVRGESIVNGTFHLGSVKDPVGLLETRFRFLKQGSFVYEEINHPRYISKIPAERLTTVTALQYGRLNAIERVFERGEPYVFIEGESGVGKTTFVTEGLPKERYKVRMGSAKVLDWANDKTEQICKVLFIDEANLSRSDWTMFHGLYHEPRGILMDGVFYPLDEGHKVIFAGNPMGYQGERHKGQFFKRPENVVTFKPLPSDVLYEENLKPLWEGIFTEAQSLLLSNLFLEIYHDIRQMSHEKELISPRELQMMALRTIAHCIELPEVPDDQTLQDIAQYFAYQVAKPLVPALHRLNFKMKYEPPSKPKIKPSGSTFLNMPSRQDLILMIDNALLLRVHRSKGLNNPLRRYGGSGGMVLEGEPGIGKSETVEHLLIDRGFKEGSLTYLDALPISDEPSPTEDKAAVPGPNVFYKIPASLSPPLKRSLLLKAFHQGALVIMDEINSSPMLESLLNALLNGRTEEGQRPQHTGFMVIGTQNPISMAGRKAQTPAQARRMTTIQVDAYDEQEMRKIVCAEGFPEEHVDDMLAAYQRQVTYAKQHDKTPSPCFRHLMDYTKYVCRAIHAKKEAGFPAASPSTLKQQLQALKQKWEEGKSPKDGGNACDI